MLYPLSYEARGTRQRVVEKVVENLLTWVGSDRWPVYRRGWGSPSTWIGVHAARSLPLASFGQSGGGGPRSC